MINGDLALHELANFTRILNWYHESSDAISYLQYCISGYFPVGGVNISWLIGFVMIRGKKIVVGSSLNFTPRARVEQWPLVLKWKQCY